MCQFLWEDAEERGGVGLEIVKLINALPGAGAQGLIWGMMAIGVYITYRILD